MKIASSGFLRIVLDWVPAIFGLTGVLLFRIMDTSLEDYSRGLRGRVGNAVGV